MIMDNDNPLTTEESTCFKRGLLDDPEIRLSFPHESVMCYQPLEAKSIPLEHQLEFCLCANYVNCPVYKGKAAAPPTIVVTNGPLSNSRMWILVPIILIGLAVALWSFSNRPLAVDEDPFRVDSGEPILLPESATTESDNVELDSTIELDTDGGEPLEVNMLPSPTLDSLFPTLEAVAEVETPTKQPTLTKQPTPTDLPTATRTVRPTRTPRPTNTPKPTATVVENVIRQPVVATPNYAATRAMQNAIATANAQRAVATWAAVSAQQTVEAQQTTTALFHVQQTATAAAANATAAAANATAAAANATATAQSAQNAWNMALTQTAEAIPPSDRDGDSIPDSEDSCPDQYGIPEFGGCNPFEDSSGDGGGNGDDGRGDGGSDGGDGRE